MDAAVASTGRRCYFRTKSDVAAVYLSEAWRVERPTAESDVDVGVLYQERAPLTLLGRPFATKPTLSERLPGTFR